MITSCIAPQDLLVLILNSWFGSWQIVGNLTVKDISIERISVDYCSYGEAPVTEGDLGHVTEIYDFPSTLKTEDLMEMFSDFQ